jgi:predicted HTH transcriptional regulator
MTDDEIRRLLTLKSEEPNLDYKGGFEWSKTNRDQKYELVRDLMALANTRDGGRVVFGVRDADLEFVGVAADIYTSIDPTDVLGMLHDNAAPKARCAVYKREIDGKRVVVFDVVEFEDTPIICTNGINSLEGNKRVLLRQAAIYIRTGAGSTEEVSAPDDMRSLLERAVRRKADELLRSFRDILTGRPAPLSVDAAELYKPEIEAAEKFLDSKLGQI